MSKSAKKPKILSTKTDFFRKGRILFVPRMPYKPQAIRESNSYGPKSKKYDDYIELFDDSESSDQDSTSRKKDYIEGNRKNLEIIHQRNANESKVPGKPILHCYNADESVVGGRVTAKKSTPIKKISFVLPGEKNVVDYDHMNWDDYHQLDVIHKFMDDLEAEFPSICTTGSIGKSLEGRNLKILKISNSNASNEAVWMDAGIHAREWIAPAVNTYIADHISRNFDKLPESVTNKDWYFLPVVNPDGYHYSHTTNRMWRKNRAYHNGECTGVDLNRNFGVGWGGKGSSNNPSNAFYRGSHPFSEPESSAMRDLFLSSGIKFKVYITLHSYGQIIIFPYSCTTEMAPDYVRLLEGATVMSKAIYNTNAETYKVGISRDVMYAAAGTSNDFAYGSAGIPYCYLIELRSKNHKFMLPKEEIKDTGNEILSSVLALMEFVDSYTYQNKVDKKNYQLLRNKDQLLGNGSFINTANSHVKQYNRRNYSYLKKRYSKEKDQGSFVRLTNLSERDSIQKTNGVKLHDSLNDLSKYEVKPGYTLGKKTEPSKTVDNYLQTSSDSLLMPNHTFINKTNSKDDGTNKISVATEFSVNHTESHDDKIDRILETSGSSVEEAESRNDVTERISLATEALVQHTGSYDNATDKILVATYSPVKETESYYDDATDEILVATDSFVKQTESHDNATDGILVAMDCPVKQTKSPTDTEDSFEAWKTFYAQDVDFHEKKNHLLQIGTSYGAADVECNSIRVSPHSDIQIHAGSGVETILVNKSNSVKVAPTEPKSQLWEAKFPEEGQRQFVKTLDTLGAINIWKEERSTMEIMVDSSRVAQVAGILHQRDIPYTIVVADITTLLEKEPNTSIATNFAPQTPKAQSKPKTMDWNSYHTLDTMYAFLDNLAAEFPYLCSVQVIGKTVEGRDLKMLKISNGVDTNQGVWMDGAIHPREWISPAVVTYIANRIVRSFNEMPESVTNKDWYILPVFNPDGYEYTHTHDRMWRKNRARYGDCIGVDLNRNFSYGFGEKGEEGSSEDPGSVFYRGPKPFSEPETIAVKRTITDAPTTFKAFLSFHSYGEVIIFPWGYTSDSCPDYVNLLEGGTAMAKAIHGTTGHTYKVGSTNDLMYYAAGTSIDWSYAVPKIPYSYMVELRSKAHRFLLPKEEIISTATEIESGVFRLMAFMDQPCTGTDSCACLK